MLHAPASPRNSLRGWLLWSLSIAVVMAAITQAFLVYHMTIRKADEVFDHHMQQVAMSLQDGVAAVPSIQSLNRDADDDDSDFVIQIWSMDGKRVFQSADGITLPLRPDTGFSSASVRGIHYRVFSVRTPTQIIKVGQDMEARQELATDMALRTIIPVLLLAPLLIVIVWLIVRRSTRPILQARAQVSMRATEDFSPLPSADLPEEVKPLVDEINLLFIRLGRSFKAQRNFVADAAHELRTPLAALRLQVQGIQRAGDEASRTIAARRLLGGVDRTTRLVEQLLILARQESVQDPPQELAAVDLVAIASLAISDCLSLARMKHIDMGLEGGNTDALVQGQPESLRILVRNLLENAVKFTPENSTVDVAIRAEGNRACLVVADSGPGIPPEERARVFDRFYRLPGQMEAGSGLGLAIVKTIAERHQGNVVLGQSAKLGGLEVEVDLPRILSPG